MLAWPRCGLRRHWGSCRGVWAPGVFPVVGTTSVIAVLFMFLFPVNGVLVQVINLLLTPVDIALVRCVPCMHWMNWCRRRTCDCGVHAGADFYSSGLACDGWRQRWHGDFDHATGKTGTLRHHCAGFAEMLAVLLTLGFYAGCEQELKSHPVSALSEFKDALLQAVAGWLAAAPVMTLAIYLVALPLCARMLPPARNVVLGEPGKGKHVE